MNEQVLNATTPMENTQDETFLGQHLDMTFAALNTEIKMSMLEVFCSAGFKHVLGARHAAIKAHMLNIVEDDPTKFKFRYAMLRTELMLLEDILEFLDRGFGIVQDIIKDNQPQEHTDVEG